MALQQRQHCNKCNTVLSKVIELRRISLKLRDQDFDNWLVIKIATTHFSPSSPGPTQLHGALTTSKRHTVATKTCRSSLGRHSSNQKGHCVSCQTSMSLKHKQRTNNCMNIVDFSHKIAYVAPVRRGLHFPRVHCKSMRGQPSSRRGVEHLGRPSSGHHL